MKKKEILDKLVDIIKFNNFTYSQPRESNNDDNAFLTIGKNLSEIYKYIKENK